MIKGQTLVASDGLEVALYPLESVRLTQNYYYAYSHGSNEVKNTGLWDITGVSGDTYKGEIFAPFTCRVVAIKTGYANGNQVIVQSVNKVHLANGDINYARFGFGHDNKLDVKLGQIIKQGDKLGDCGDYGNVSGVHSHIMVGVGEWTLGNSIPTCKNKNNATIFYMPNAIDIDDMFYVNGIRSYGKYKTADKITTKDGVTTYYMSLCKYYCYFKEYTKSTLDLTQFIVERDESKHQVELTEEIIRARNNTIISDETYLGVKMPKGIYNVVEKISANNYDWIKVADGVYFALTGNCYIEYQADTTDYKKLYKALLSKYNTLESEYETLKNNNSSLQENLTQAKEKINKAIEVLK